MKKGLFPEGVTNLGKNDCTRPSLVRHLHSTYSQQVSSGSSLSNPLLRIITAGTSPLVKGHMATARMGGLHLLFTVKCGFKCRLPRGRRPVRRRPVSRRPGKVPADSTVITVTTAVPSTRNTRTHLKSCTPDAPCLAFRHYPGYRPPGYRPRRTHLGRRPGPLPMNGPVKP
jgi:hypothetical protein